MGTAAFICVIACAWVAAMLLAVCAAGSWASLQRFFLQLTAATDRAIRGLGERLGLLGVESQQALLSPREEAALEHKAFEPELIVQMRELGTLNHTSCWRCQDHNIAVLEGYAFGEITTGAVTGERISTLPVLALGRHIL